LNANNKRDLEIELARLGSSLTDVQRAFNEKIIAGEWLRSKVKVNEDVSPDELIEYYRSHLADYDYPSQARWEEMMVRKDRFKDEAAKSIVKLRQDARIWTVFTGNVSVDVLMGRKPEDTQKK